MATIQCSISGLELKIPHVSMHLKANEGYVHPIFYLKQRYLWNYYKRHCAGELTQTESYLVFLALLHSTGHVKWRTPCRLYTDLDYAVNKVVERNIKQLAYVISLTNKITIPSFRQPKFTINTDNCMLQQIQYWIKAWADNIDYFKLGLRNQKLQESLQRTENRLTHLIRSGIEPERYAAVVASWAAKAADFPADRRESWTRTIRLCFNDAQMFRTELSELRAIKEYCEVNIPPGSIHTHALYRQLREGIRRHTDYLGMSYMALGYTIISEDTTIGDAAIEEIVNKAPLDKPKREDYDSSIEFIRANLAYQVAMSKLNKETTNEQQ